MNSQSRRSLALSSDNSVEVPVEGVIIPVANGRIVVGLDYGLEIITSLRQRKWPLLDPTPV